MKAICLYQPWASLVMIGAKPYEFRPKSYLDNTAYRGHPQPGDRIVIHASARKICVAEVADLLNRLGTADDTTALNVGPAMGLLDRVWKSFELPRKNAPPMPIPLGAGLGTAIIGPPALSCDIFNLTVAPMQVDSDRGQFNWAWPLTDIEPFAAPIPMRGLQGFWNWRGPAA
jgi:hypothetical protein